MEAVVLVIHLIVALAIIAIVLIQPSEAGGFLGSSGSMSNMMAPRRGVDGLTRTTTILAGCFFLTSLTLAIIAENRSAATSSILDAAEATPPVEAPAVIPVTPDQAVPPPDSALKSAPATTPQDKKPVAPISK